MNERTRYYKKLLEGRAKRLNDLLDASAPMDMVFNEIMLLVRAAEPLKPPKFKSWNYCQTEEKHNEPERYKVATG